MKKRLFKVYWTEYHDPVNWEGVKKMRETLKKGRILYGDKRGFKLSVTTRLDPNEHDGWHECEITAKFHAKDVKDAISVVEDENLYDESSGVYSAFEKISGKWIRSFTEEGIDEPEPPEIITKANGDKEWL
jgi:hypothetical protein